MELESGIFRPDAPFVVLKLKAVEWWNGRTGGVPIEVSLIAPSCPTGTNESVL